MQINDTCFLEAHRSNHLVAGCSSSLESLSRLAVLLQLYIRVAEQLMSRRIDIQILCRELLEVLGCILVLTQLIVADAGIQSR